MRLYVLPGDNITVLAPTDEAFDKLPEGVLPGLLKEFEKLKRIMHFIVSNFHLIIPEN